VIAGLGSFPGSVTVYVYVFVSPSLAVVAPERTTVGATLATETDRESEPMLFEGSPSFAETDTVEVAGPSGKRQSKLFAAGVFV
jgi:hypothetical protein